MIPFRGWLIFKQYISGKSSKYGTKLLKLCDSKGYTYNFTVYGGTTDAATGNDNKVSNAVVKALMKECIGEGCTLATNNFYNNLDLAQYLIENKYT